MEQAPSTVDVRCPVGSRNLLLKMRTDPESALGISSQNAVLIACRDCTKHSRREMASAGLSTNFRVVHEFSILGEYLDSYREPTS